MAKPHRKSGLREHCVGEGCVQQGVDLEADIHIPGLRSQLHDYCKGVLIPIPPGCRGLNMMMLAVAYGIQPGH